VDIPDQVREIIDVLRRAAASQSPVLIEDCDVLMPSVLLALDIEPHLLPEGGKYSGTPTGRAHAADLDPLDADMIGEAAFRDFERGGYRIFLATQVVEYLPPSHALAKIAVVNWEADASCMENITMDAVSARACILVIAHVFFVLYEMPT
jgi:hypothetical protein